MKDDKKSIVKEALVDYKDIQQAADANAKKRLADEFPKEFSNILKEELQNKNKSVKESYKKVDSAELKNESDMKNLTKETVKVVDTIGDGDPFDKTAKGAKKIEELKATKPFTDSPKGVKKLEEEREKDFMGDVEAKTPNQGKGEAAKGKVFNEKLKGPSSGKPISNLKEEVNISELDMTGIGEALDGADNQDQFISLEEIEKEITSMENLGEELGGQTQVGSPFEKLTEMRNELDEILQSMGTVGEQKNNGGRGANQVTPGGPTRDKIVEFGMEEMKNNGGRGANQVTPGGPTRDKIVEIGLQPDEMSPAEFGSVAENQQELPITDEEINEVLGGMDAPVDENKTRTLANMKKMTATVPGKEYAGDGAVNKMRGGVQESQKKISSLIEENKKLTKKLNETKKYKESVTGLVESYKSALDKYRSQLKEMAVFNTNLAHVNNLLVNEELALTQEDKIKIINEFKKVDNIASSQKVYKNFLTEMKTGKKTLTESIENKVSASIQPSSKQKLDEVVEKTAYADDKHIQKMKRIIETIEHRGKKIIK